MKRVVFILVFVFFVSCAIANAQETKGRFRIQGYAEYINFTDNEIDNSTWGGGALARYLVLDWFGLQTNVSFYNDCETDELGGDLSVINWRFSPILHTYLTGIDDRLYVYGGGGVGVQINGDVGDVGIDDALTGHVLGGVGFDISEIFNVEAEVGYQFGSADTSGFENDEIGVEAVFIRAGGGIRF